MNLIDMKYQVVRPLGTGFGGEVYLVEGSGQLMALKKLRIHSNYKVFSSGE